MPALRKPVYRRKNFAFVPNTVDSLSSRVKDMVDNQPDFFADGSCTLPWFQPYFEMEEGLRNPARTRRIEAAISVCGMCPVLKKCSSWSKQIDREALESSEHTTRWPWVDIVVGGQYYPPNRNRN